MTEPSTELPTRFCWTRFGTEASEGIDAIIARKEQERLASDGLFLWGIGNAVGISIKELVRCEPDPQVLFSPIKSKPRATDSSPAVVVAWRAGIGLDGHRWELPKTIMVTSGIDPAKPLRPHYALVCFRNEPLSLAAGPPVIVAALLRNLISGNRVGASQVTAVVKRAAELQEGDKGGGLAYAVALRTQLASPYFVELSEPEVLHNSSGVDLGYLARGAQLPFA